MTRREPISRSIAASFVAVIILWVGVAPVVQAQIAPLEDLAGFPRCHLQIESKRTGANHDIEAWIADTPARQAQGLMFVRELPATRGMLFVYDEPRMLGMWMKNTYIELDMLFIRADGRVAWIAEHAQPHSLDTIAAPHPVQYVLELRGGEVQRLGLRTGDRVWRLTEGKRTKL